MKLPTLNHEVILQQRADTVSAVGQRTDTWAELLAVWARVRPLQGRELLAAQATHALVDHEVMTRYTDQLAGIVLADLRVLFRGRVLAVRAVLDVEERQEWLRLLCSEGAHER